MEDKKRSSKRAATTTAKRGAAAGKSVKAGGAGAKAGKAKPASAKGAKGARATTTATKARGAAATKARGEVAASEPAPKKVSKKTSLPPPKPDPISERKLQAKQTAIAIAVAALDKKAERIEIVDISEKVDYADYLVVMTGRSDRQVVAIADGIQDGLKKRGGRATGVEGIQQGHWVLMDCGDVIVHIFLEEARKYYDLDSLWMDAPRVPTPAFTNTPVGEGGIARASTPPPGDR